MIITARFAPTASARARVTALAAKEPRKGVLSSESC
jgi:hypothetical protein